MNVVTGAFSFTGKYITRRLLELGEEVRTLTDHPGRQHPFGAAVPAAPLSFQDPAILTGYLTGATTLYNTYWIRFEHGGMTFEGALHNTAILLQAARKAGVCKIVHISASHADEASPYPYFRAKGRAERLVRESGLSFAILRPTLLFGEESTLFNNIAWMLRKFPVFALLDRECRLQPVFVEDVAELAVESAQEEQIMLSEVAGPEIFTFEEMVHLIADAIGRRVKFMHVHPERLLQLSRMIGGMAGETILTRSEVDALLQNLLVAEGPAAGRTLFSDWVRRNAAVMGSRYVSELERHFR